MSARQHLSQKPNFIKFSVHVAYSFGSVLLRRRYHTQCTCTFDFLDDVSFAFAHNWPGKLATHRSNCHQGAAPYPGRSLTSTIALFIIADNAVCAVGWSDKKSSRRLFAIPHVLIETTQSPPYQLACRHQFVRATAGGDHATFISVQLYIPVDIIIIVGYFTVSRGTDCAAVK